MKIILIFRILLFAVILSFLVFWPFFSKGYLPIPADIITAGYYPWADSAWGYPVKVPIKNSLPSDIPSLLYPWQVRAVEIIKSGSLPLWDNSILLGAPLLANFQVATLGAWAFVLIISYLFHSSVSGNIQRRPTLLNRQ